MKQVSAQENVIKEREYICKDRKYRVDAAEGTIGREIAANKIFREKRANYPVGCKNEFSD